MCKKFKNLTIILIFCFIATSIFASDIVHIMKKGDTVYSLSQQYNITMKEILKYNKITNASKIQVGQKIYIPVKTKQNVTNYKIQKGDTIYGIAQKFGLKRASILNENNLTEKSIIKVGQIIKIPSKSSTLVSNSKKSNITQQTSITNISKYTTKKGDTIYGIAQKLGIKGAEILKLNGLTANSIIKPGQIIKIPSTKTQTTNNTKKPNVKPPVDLLKYSDKKGNPNLLWPVTAKKVSYISGKIYGVAIESSTNESVKTIASGKVVSSGPYRGYGNVVFIQSKTKHIYVYGGLSQITVKIGDKLKLGQKIGELASGGLLKPSKLYFMVYEKNKPIDPAKAPRGL